MYLTPDPYMLYDKHCWCRALLRPININLAVAPDVACANRYIGYLAPGEKASVSHRHSCSLCTCIVRSCPNFSATSPFTVLWRFAFVVFIRNSFFVSFCFSPNILFFRSERFVFVLVSVLGRSGCGTLPQLLNSERIPFTIRGKL